MRYHLFEFEDLKWFPNSIREGGTDYLRYFLNAVEFYKPIIPLISETLCEIKEHHIIDLCSGGGGAIEQINKELQKNTKEPITITLTDKFPNTNAYKHLKEKNNNQIDFLDDSIDAKNVPKDLKGLRTMFSAIHHFDPDTIIKILKNSVEHNAGICFFDGGDKNIFTIFGIVIFHPIAFILFTPFFKPFKLSRLFFTYIIPLIPLTTVWDGCVSILRLYNPNELLGFAKQVEDHNYIWKSGKVRNKLGMNITYLIGYPNSNKG
ncbi:MAG: class I SAM-dependent methyltransferase [Saprospiraceae bacterium]|nr:class I SAM-dependent methyltransferase [Candidatus Defluviibacterium haderslevense]